MATCIKTSTSSFILEKTGKADFYGNEKRLRKWTRSVFFFFFFDLMGTRMVQIRIAKSVWAFRNKTTDGFGAQIRSYQRYKTANGFRTRRNYYYIWPIILLELKYIITSARNAVAIAKGMVELRSIVFYSREERARWRQGPRCLSCLKLRMVGGLGGLMMTPRRSSWCGECIPELTTRRHRGRSQAPWTVVMLGQPS